MFTLYVGVIDFLKAVFFKQLARLSDLIWFRFRPQRLKIQDFGKAVSNEDVLVSAPAAQKTQRRRHGHFDAREHEGGDFVA